MRSQPPTLKLRRTQACQQLTTDPTHREAPTQLLGRGFGMLMPQPCQRHGLDRCSGVHRHGDALLGSHVPEPGKQQPVKGWVGVFGGKRIVRHAPRLKRKRLAANPLRPQVECGGCRSSTSRSGGCSRTLVPPDSSGLGKPCNRAGRGLRGSGPNAQRHFAGSFRNTGRSVAALIFAIVSRTHSAFCCISLRGKSCSCSAKYCASCCSSGSTACAWAP